MSEGDRTPSTAAQSPRRSICSLWLMQSGGTRPGEGQSLVPTPASSDSLRLVPLEDSMAAD